MSLTNIKNNKGPKLDPWGTPQVMMELIELTDLQLTICFLFVK